MNGEGQDTLTPPMLLTAEHVARALGISRSKVFELDAGGRLPLPVNLGLRCRRWRAEELRDWVRAGAPPRARWEWVDK